MIVPLHGDVDRVHKVRGDKKLDANERQQLASSFLSPLTLRTWPRYITVRMYYGTHEEQIECPQPVKHHRAEVY